MNCDQAFERLTEANATADAGLVRHLEQCPRCRAMQQTLSPALDWLQSASHDDFTPSARSWTPGDSPLLTDESVAIATEVARRFPRRGLGCYSRKALGMALVAMFGMAFGVFAIGKPPESAHVNTSNALPPQATACLWPPRDDENTLLRGNAQAVVDSCIACHVPAMLRN